MRVNKKGLLLAAVAVALLGIWAVVFLPGFKETAAVGEIYLEGELVRTVPLSQPGSFTLAEDETVHFLVERGAIRFHEASCPDKICENSGFLSKTGQTAACLPKKILLKIAGGEAPKVDMVAQ